jgi:hypothetical protein
MGITGPPELRDPPPAPSSFSAAAKLPGWDKARFRLPRTHADPLGERAHLYSRLNDKQHVTVSSAHGEQHLARRAYLRIAGFMFRLRQSAEQLDALGRWYCILSEALRHYLHGRQLEPPIRLNPA